MTITEFFALTIAIYGLYRITRFSNRKRTYLINNGIPASATVVSISKTGMEVGTSSVFARPIMNIVLTFEVEGVRKRVVVDQHLDTREIPKVGDSINIRIHPQDHNKVLIV